VIEILVYTCVMLFAIFVMVIGGFKLVDLTLRLNQISPGLRIPMGYVYTVLPFSGILMILYSAGFMSEALKKSEGPSEHQISPLD
jgi:TRAP-type C4-dicarboxylate transport system permease small subunit